MEDNIATMFAALVRAWLRRRLRQVQDEQDTPAPTTTPEDFEDCADAPAQPVQPRGSARVMSGRSTSPARARHSSPVDVTTSIAGKLEAGWRR